MSFLDEFRRDLAYAARQLIKNPMFTGIVVAILAFGVGANTALFSVFRAVFLEPVPYPAPEQLIALRHTEQ